MLFGQMSGFSSDREAEDGKREDPEVLELKGDTGWKYYCKERKHGVIIRKVVRSGYEKRDCRCLIRKFGEVQGLFFAGLFVFFFYKKKKSPFFIIIITPCYPSGI